MRINPHTRIKLDQAQTIKRKLRKRNSKHLVSHLNLGLINLKQFSPQIFQVLLIWARTIKRRKVWMKGLKEFYKQARILNDFGIS